MVAVNGTQQKRRRQIHAAFAQAQQTRFAAVEAQHCDAYPIHEQGHGRSEQRRSWTWMDPAMLKTCDPEGRWRDLRAIGMVRAERTSNGKPVCEERYCITSLDGDARTFGDAVRIDWAIENVVQWTLDIVFRQDASRVMIGHGPENLAVIQHLALKLRKQEPASRASASNANVLVGTRIFSPASL